MYILCKSSDVHFVYNRQFDNSLVSLQPISAQNNFLAEIEMEGQSKYNQFWRDVFFI